MRPKSLILLLLALGCGLVASIGISQVMANRNQAVAPTVETERILVANKDIKVNEPLSAKMFKSKIGPKKRFRLMRFAISKSLMANAPVAAFWSANRFVKPSSPSTSESMKYLTVTASLPYQPMR